jgi:hypothetical protein
MFKRSEPQGAAAGTFLVQLSIKPEIGLDAFIGAAEVVR